MKKQLFKVSFSLILTCCFLVLSPMKPADVQAKPKKKSNHTNLMALTPGAFFKQDGAEVLVLDRGWRLVWPSTGVLQVVNAQGVVLAQADLSQRPDKLSSAEAHDLDLEERDLGSGHGGRYLQGKKQPKGRAFKREGLSHETPEAAKPKVSTRQVQGIKITTQAFPNGSKIFKWDWGRTKESVFLDRRDTMVWVKQERAVPGGTLSLQQFSDGSFTRRLQKIAGSFAYTWDVLSNSAQLTFSNVSGQAVAEFRCDMRGTCDQS